MFVKRVGPWETDDFLNICESQDGVFTREQAVASGISLRSIQWNLQKGRWDRMFPGVYRIHGGALSRVHILRGAVLWAAPSGAASHLSAAFLWGITEELSSIEVTIATKRKPLVGVVVHQRALDPAEITAIEGIRVTRPERTVLDVATRNPRLAEEALDVFLRRKDLVLDQMHDFLDSVGRSGVPGISAVREMLSLRTPDQVESALERRLLKSLLGWGLPMPVSQYAVVASGQRFRLDFAYPRLKVAIETDGYRYHSGRERFDRDTARRNALTLAGWIVVHVTWVRLRDTPWQIRQEIAAALASASHRH